MSVQQVASEDGPVTPSDGISCLLPYPHLFSSRQVRGHVCGSLVISVSCWRPYLVKDSTLFHDGQTQVAMGQSGRCHHVESKGVDPCDRSGEYSRVRVVSVADVGDGLVERKGGVGAQGNTIKPVVGGEYRREGHCQDRIVNCVEMHQRTINPYPVGVLDPGWARHMYTEIEIIEDDDVELHVLGCRVDILGINCDQCLNMVQCCFTSTETIRLIRTGAQDGHRLSHNS